MNFQKKFEKIVVKNNSLLCVGLDPDSTYKGFSLAKGKKSLLKFNKSIIEQTSDLVCAYKPNIAFYEACGLEGLSQLKQTIEYLKVNYPDIPIILDAKRADVGNTAKMYAKSIYGYWNADSTTVYPHLGFDSLEPFFKHEEKLTIVIIKTSNPDAKMFQDLKLDGRKYWQKVAEEIKKWNIKNLGIFVGATYPNDLKKIRELFSDKIILSAGLGTQGGNIKESVRAGVDKYGAGIIFNASRSIIYSKNPHQEAQKLRDEINKYR